MSNKQPTSDSSKQSKNDTQSRNARPKVARKLTDLAPQTTDDESASQHVRGGNSGGHILEPDVG